MVFKIKTAKKTMLMFKEISASTNFAPFILSKLAISLSIKNGKPLSKDDLCTDSFGLELNRQTITGEWDELYKSLIQMLENRHIGDNDYFPKYLKAHLDRGAKLLYSEFKYNNDLIASLLTQKEGI